MGSIGEMLIDRKKVREKTAQFVHQNSHIDCPAKEPTPPW
jgi:hypothetical protein